jgi:hypothetical protein
MVIELTFKCYSLDMCTLSQISVSDAYSSSDPYFLRAYLQIWYVL